MRLPIIGPFGRAQASTADPQELRNFYLENLTSGQGILLPTPGVSLFVTLPNTPGRGLYTINGRLFASAGDLVYEIQEDGRVIVLSTSAMNVDKNPCTFACSGDISNQLLISSGNRGYCSNLSTGVWTAIPVGTLPGAAFVAFLNNFFLALNVATNTLYVSTFNDALTWPGGQAQQRSVSGDKWLSMIADGQYAWLFGGQKTDVYQLAGTGNTIFVPVQGVSLNYGIGAPYSVALVDNAPQWVGANEHGRGMILRAEGFRALRRSTTAVEFAIDGYDQVQSAVGFSYQQSGHTHYVCNFPDDADTWTDDASRDPRDSWHKRGYWNAGALRYDAYRPQFHAACFNKHFVQDRENGNIYQLTPTSALDVDGQGIRRLRRTPRLTSSLNRVFYKSLVLDLEPGLGVQVGQGSDPQVMIRWSDDGAKTWSDEVWISAGRIGQYGTRVDLQSLGMGRQRVFEFVMTDPVPWNIIDGYVEATVGRN